MLKTMTASMKGVQVNDALGWEMLVSFRRFLHSHSHQELQTCATELFITAGKNNADTVWLVLFSTMATDDSPVSFLQRAEWDTKGNGYAIMRQL